jgi:hypothetical protein
MLFGAGGVIIAAAVGGFWFMTRDTVTPPVVSGDTSTVATAPPTAAPSETKAPAGGGSPPPADPMSRPVVNPPADGGRTGGATTQSPPVADPAVDEDAQALDELDNTKVSESNAPQIIRRTDVLLRRVQDARRGLLLLRRAEAKLALDDQVGGCADLSAADRVIKEGSPYFRALKNYIESFCTTP